MPDWLVVFWLALVPSLAQAQPAPCNSSLELAVGGLGVELVNPTPQPAASQGGHRKYQWEICLTLLNHLAVVGCWYELSLAQPGSGLVRLEFTRFSVGRLGDTGCEGGYMQVVTSSLE